MIRTEKRWHQLIKSDFYRNIIGLFSGIFAARLVPALFAILIARLYAPDDFGIFVLFLSISSLVSIFANGGYEGALLLAGSTAEKRQLFSLGLKTNTIISGIFLAAMLLSLMLPATIRGNSLMLLMIPLHAFFFGALQLIRNNFISNKLFKRLASLELCRALASGILQSLFFIFPTVGLFLGVTLAQALTFAVFFLYLPENEKKSLPGKTKRDFSLPFSIGKALRYTDTEKALARRYANFPRFSVPSEFFNFLSSQLPVFMIQPFFGKTMLGLYSFSHRYLSIPVQLTSISIGSVYIQKVRSLQETPDDLETLTWDLFRKQVTLGIVPFTLLALWGKEIFSLLFGAEWAFSGSLASLLSPWLFMVFTGSPLSTILIAREKQKVSMVFNILLLIARAALLLAGGFLLKELTLTIALYSLTGLLFFGFLTFYSLRLAGVKTLRAFLFLAKATALAVVPLLILRLWMNC